MPTGLSIPGQGEEVSPSFILQIVPPSLAEDASSYLPQTLTVLLGYLVVLGVISCLARGRYTGEFSDYATASRSLGWVVTTLTILATHLEWGGVGRISRIRLCSRCPLHDLRHYGRLCVGPPDLVLRASDKDPGTGARF